MSPTACPRTYSENKIVQRNKEKFPASTPNFQLIYFSMAFYNFGEIEWHNQNRLLYSQAASKAYYEQRRREAQHSLHEIERVENVHQHNKMNTFEVQFPPLPPTPHPANHMHYGYYPQRLFHPPHQSTGTIYGNHPPSPIPTDLLDNTSTSPKRPALQVDSLDFENTSLKKFIDWCDGKLQCLPPYVASQLGLDVWLYKLRNKPTPTSEQESLLRNKILELAQQSPLGLYEAVERKQLRNYLGTGFEWLEAEVAW